ncbi:AAA family ATPase [Candidatus Poriferisodalis sp.]|uniref:AAA family ATPase n=1 Tax=Candidatus Poriferisodalis sp. TaxID=3101277 RepID=UPI003D0C782D
MKLSEDGRVPLRSLGDGAVRMFAVGVALANAANGFLLIDEAENGIHHTLQQDYWKLIFRAAREHNVQVLATTHRWDCVAGFARAACNDQESEGVALRLEPDDDDGGVRAIEYTERMLKVAADRGIEVR